jgi:hypothetical protein
MDLDQGFCQETLVMFTKLAGGSIALSGPVFSRPSAFATRSEWIC